MGKQKPQNENNIFSIKGILKFMAIGGVITAAIAAPNAVLIFGFLINGDNHVSWKKFNQSRARQYIKQLKKNGLIKETGLKRKKVFSLTKKGRERIEKHNINELSLKGDTWDGKWRVVIFDIPEQQKKARDALHRKFKRLGMRQLQKSVFVYPFPCKEEIDFVSDFFGVHRHILYLESKIADIDEDLKRIFQIG